MMKLEKHKAISMILNSLETIEFALSAGNLSAVEIHRFGTRLLSGDLQRIALSLQITQFALQHTIIERMKTREN